MDIKAKVGDSVGKLLEETGVPVEWAETVEESGDGKFIQTPVRVEAAATAALAAQAAAVNALWALKTGKTQEAFVDPYAAAQSLVSCYSLRYGGGHPVSLPEQEYPTVGMYETGDGRFIMLNGGYPRLRNGLLKLLECYNDEESIGKAVARYSGEVLEEKIAGERLCGALVRTPEEWEAHDQGVALASLPAVSIEKVGDSPKEPLPEGPRPLSGVRVLDATHVLAGPVASRTLAEQGADVLNITSPVRPSIPSFAMDTGHGKRSAHLQLLKADYPTEKLDTEEGRRMLADSRKILDLGIDGDVLVYGYSPESLQNTIVTVPGTALGERLSDERKFSVNLMHELRPGAIFVELSCYGHAGPWAKRKGWEQLAQSTTGLVADHNNKTLPPELIPACPCDYTTGYLAAFGILSALYRRATEGGTYHVRVSLSRTAMWIRQFGNVDPGQLMMTAVAPEATAKLFTTTNTPYGPLQHQKPVSWFSETKARWDLPTAPLGSYAAEWLPRTGEGS